MQRSAPAMPLGSSDSTGSLMYATRWAAFRFSVRCLTRMRRKSTALVVCCALSLCFSALPRSSITWCTSFWKCCVVPLFCTVRQTQVNERVAHARPFRLWMINA